MGMSLWRPGLSPKPSTRWCNAASRESRGQLKRRGCCSTRLFPDNVPRHCPGWALPVTVVRKNLVCRTRRSRASAPQCSCGANCGTRAHSFGLCDRLLRISFVCAEVTTHGAGLMIRTGTGPGTDLCSQLRIQSKPDLVCPVSILARAAHLLIPFPCASPTPHQIGSVPCHAGCKHAHAHILFRGQAKMLRRGHVTEKIGSVHGRNRSTYG